MNKYFHRTFVNSYRFKRRKHIFPVMKCSRETKWALFESLFIAYVKVCQEFNKGLLIDQKTEQLYQQISNSLSQKEKSYRIYLAIYKSELYFSRKKDDWSRLFLKLNQVTVFSKKDIKHFENKTIEIKPIIFDINDREFIKDTLLRMFQFIFQLRALPFIDFRLLLDWKYQEKLHNETPQYPELNPEYWELAKRDD